MPPCFDLLGFNPSCITVVEGSSGIVPDVLFRLCVSSVISLGRDAVFIDGWNSFNPYALSRMAKSTGAERGKALSRIHVRMAGDYSSTDMFLSICPYRPDR